MSLAGIVSATDWISRDDPLLAALDLVEDGASLATPDGVLVYVNPAEERLFGYANGELVGQHVSVQNAYSPEANARIVETVVAALRERGQWSGEWFNRRKDGTVFVTSSEIRTIQWRGTTHWLCIQRLSAQSKAESERLALAAEAAQLGIWEWDIPSNTFVYSPRARAICGFAEAGEVTYEDVARVTHPEDFPHTSAQAKRALDPALRDRSPFEYRIVKPDGALRWVRAYGYAVFSDHEPDPKPLKYVGTLEDITERVIARRTEKEAARQVSLALDSARMAIWSLDIVNRRLQPSPEFNRLFGFALDEEPTLEEIEARYAPGADDIQRAWSEALARRDTTFEAEYAIIRPDGAQRWLHVRSDVQYRPDGAPDRAIGVIIDVTDRRLTQDALSESESRFREAADSAPAPVWMTDEGGKIEFVNKALCDFAGGAARELLGNIWMTRLHPDDSANVISERQRAWAGGHVPYSFEARFRRQDGQWRWLTVSSNPRRDTKGNFRGYVGLAVDRTDEREALAVLKESEERFRMLADSAPVMIWMSDAKGQCLYLNAALRNFWGVAEGALDGFDWRQMMHADDEPHITGAVVAAIGAEQSFSVQGRYFDAAGDVRIVRTRGEPRRSPEGRFLGMVGVNVDLTEIVAAQQAFEESRRRLQTIADSAPALIWTADPQGVLTFHNERWSAYVGASGLGAADWLASKLHRDDAHACLERWRAALQTGGPVEFEARFRRHDGEFRWFLVRASAVKDAEGRVVEWAGSSADIHDRKLAEQRQKLLLDELNHRVKNTLTVVQSLALQTFRNTSDPVSARKAFDGRLAALAAAHTLLTQSNWESADLHSLIKEALLVCGDAGDRVVRTGPALLLRPKQALSVALVLHELCTNALKHGALSTSGGGVELTWEAVDGEALQLIWREHGGPSVRAPERRGFGTVLLERAVVHDLGGQAEIGFDASGVQYALTLPLTGPDRDA
jgi:PAS domain S-box-containing protein